MQLLAIDNPPRPFWNRRTALFACAGLLCYLVSLWVFPIASLPVLAVLSLVRFAPMLAIIRKRAAWPVAFATPYPFALIFSAYSERRLWLPESLAMQLSNPTAFLLFVSAFLLASIPLTNWMIAKSIGVPIGAYLRSLARLLFGLTAFAAIVSVPQWSVLILQYVTEPVALAGYSALLGADSVDATPTSESAQP